MRKRRLRDIETNKYVFVYFLWSAINYMTVSEISETPELVERSSKNIGKRLLVLFPETEYLTAALSRYLS